MRQSAGHSAIGRGVNPVYTATGVALMTVDATPVMIGNGWVDESGQFRLSIQGVVNQQYAVEASTDLLEWTVLATGLIPASTVWEFADGESLLFPYRFYRVLHRPGARSRRTEPQPTWQ